MCEPDPWQLRRAGTVTTMEQSCATSSRGTACREHYPSTDAPASDVIDLCSDSDDEHKVGRQAHGSAALPRASDPARQVRPLHVRFLLHHCLACGVICVATSGSSIRAIAFPTVM